jgi:small subunit ribosomal protein S20
VARTKSAVKNIRKSRKRNIINRARRSRLRTQIRKLNDLVARKDAEGASGALKPTLSVIARAQKQGIIHRNTAARYKSRLSRLVARMTESP